MSKYIIGCIWLKEFELRKIHEDEVITLLIA